MVIKSISFTWSTTWTAKMDSFEFRAHGRKRANTAEDAKSRVLQRFPFLNFLPSSARNHLVAMIGELVGTFMFLFFAYAGTSVANSVGPTTVTDSGSDTSRLLYISLCFGFSLAVNAWVFFRISGGLFNPAVSTLPLSFWGHSSADQPRGDPRNVSGRCGAPPPRWIDFCCTTTRCNIGRGGGSCSLSWRREYPYYLERRYFSRARGFHRDVLNSPTGVYHIYAGSRKAQGHLHSSHRYWTLALCRGTHRGLCYDHCPGMYRTSLTIL